MILPVCGVATGTVNTKHCTVHVSIFADSTEAQAHFSTITDLRSGQRADELPDILYTQYNTWIILRVSNNGGYLCHWCDECSNELRNASLWS